MLRDSAQKRVKIQEALITAAVLIIKPTIFIGSKYCKNGWFYFEDRSTGAGVEAFN